MRERGEEKEGERDLEDAVSDEEETTQVCKDGLGFAKDAKVHNAAGISAATL